jgi:hypothetical protein
MSASRETLAARVAAASRKDECVAGAERVASLVEKTSKLEKTGNFERLVVAERELLHARGELARAEAAMKEAEAEVARSCQRDEEAEEQARRAQLVARGKALEPKIIDALEQAGRLIGERLAVDEKSGEGRLDLRALAQEATSRICGGRTPSSAWECRQIPGVLLFAPAVLAEFEVGKK